MKEFFKKNRDMLISSFIMGCLPLICCIVHCRLQGYGLREVYLPTSQWNDELFYFKQVEAILENGYPYGYYGFNEGHAAYLSFAAWSPVLLIPWVIWGVLFGWNMMSPIWCNIFLMGTAITLFVLLTRPSRKQIGMLAVLYAAFPMFTRYILSCMPEVFCFFTAVVFYGVAISYCRYGQSKGKLAWMFGLSVLMTLMRPYLILMMFLPGFFWILKTRKWWSVAGTLGIMGTAFGMYVLINKWLGAEYLEPLFSVEWLNVMLREGIFSGIKYIVYTLMDKGIQFMRMAAEAFKSGYADGIYFAVFLVAYVMLLIQFVQDLRNKKKEELLLFGHSILCSTGAFAALLLMFRIYDCKRHLMIFVVTAIFMLCLAEWKQYLKVTILSVLCIYLYGFKTNSNMDFQIPFVDQESVEAMQYWTDKFAEEMDICYENVPNYESAVIWVLADSRLEDTEELIDWQVLYGVPKGMGINCCQSQYVKENIESIKCRYIVTLSGGSVDEVCMLQGFQEIGRKENVVAYKLY